MTSISLDTAGLEDRTISSISGLGVTRLCVSKINIIKLFAFYKSLCSNSSWRNFPYFQSGACVTNWTIILLCPHDWKNPVCYLCY